MDEIWKPVVGYEGLYEVSNMGNVRSLFRYKKVLKPSPTNGYLTVELWKDKERKRVGIHVLVAMAFIHNPDNLPEVNHKNEVRSDNNVENLEWCTHLYNMNYGTAIERRVKHTDYTKPCYKENAIKNGKKVSKQVSQYTKSGEFVKTYESAKQAYRETGISQSHILECCHCQNGRMTAGKYVWKFEEDDKNEKR